MAGARRGTAKTKTPLMKCPDRARSCGGRRARAAPAWVPSGRRCGGMAARRTVRNRATIPTSCRARWCLGALRSALSAKLRDGELRVVQRVSTWPTTRPRTGEGARDARSTERSVLLVDVMPNTERTAGNDRNLALGARNLRRREAGASREVNVYDLLGHEQVLLSEAAAAKLSEALAVMKQRLRRDQAADRDRKGRHQEGRRTHAVLRSGSRGQQDADPAAVQKLFKVKVEEVRTVNNAGKLRRRGRFAGYPFGLEKGLRQAEAGREDAGVRGDLRCRSKTLQSRLRRRAVSDGGVARGHHQADSGEVAGRRQAQPADATARAGSARGSAAAGTRRPIATSISSATRRASRPRSRPSSTIRTARARIALLHYVDGEKRYIIAPVGLEVGRKMVSGPEADI